MARADVTPEAARAAGLTFDLPFYGGFATYTIEAYMTRNRNWDRDDDFTVLSAADGSFLGWGATKDEAVSSAQCELADVAEVAGCLSGRVDRPYGPLVRVVAGPELFGGAK